MNVRPGAGLIKDETVQALPHEHVRQLGSRIQETPLAGKLLPDHVAPKQALITLMNASPHSDLLPFRQSAAAVDPSASATSLNP